MGVESVKIKKLSLLFFSLITLNVCIETTAFLGPAITVGTSGNVYQAGISYASNNIIYYTTGKYFKMKSIEGNCANEEEDELLNT